jgi:hypothetical protein
MINLRAGMSGGAGGVDSPWEKLMEKFKENQQRTKDKDGK